MKLEIAEIPHTTVHLASELTNEVAGGTSWGLVGGGSENSLGAA